MNPNWLTFLEKKFFIRDGERPRLKVKEMTVKCDFQFSDIPDAILFSKTKIGTCFEDEELTCYHRVGNYHTLMTFTVWFKEIALEVLRTSNSLEQFKKS